MNKKRMLPSLVALALMLCGSLLLIGAILGSLIYSASFDAIGQPQVWGLIGGLSLVSIGFLLQKWLTDDLRFESSPQIILSLLLFISLTFVLVVMVNFVESFIDKFKIIQNNNQDNIARLQSLESVSSGTTIRSYRCSTPSHYLVPPVKFVTVVSGLSVPVYVTHAFNDKNRLYVVEKAGRVRIIENGVLLPELFLDIYSRVLSDESDPPGNTWEQGLLSIAFHPNYHENGRVFVFYTALDDGRTILAEYRVPKGSTIADSSTERIIMEIGQPHEEHNGGLLKFGSDGFLYIGMGDGGGADSEKNAQDLGLLFGKILRIDVNQKASYDIPFDNPFVDQKGIRPEIYAFGFRNPWRFSFDRCTENLFVGDVGGGYWEEVNLVIKGGNYGWRFMEGHSCRTRATGCDRNQLQFPISVYGHTEKNDAKGGSAIIGGYVYRGKKFPELEGHYFFADFMSRRLWVLTKTKQAPNRWVRQEILQLSFMPTSFGEGADGELYLTDFNGSVHQLEQVMSTENLK